MRYLRFSQISTISRLFIRAKVTNFEVVLIENKIMTSTFFETVCLSDKERVQSSVIAWIFSDECKAISLQDKLTALENLIKPTSKWNNINSIEPLVEWQHMDILILLKEGGDLKDVVVIENKIKCDLHDNQLTRYSSQLTSQYILDKNGIPKNKK